MTSWDFSGAPELREALIDALADALVSYVERQEAEATTGATPTGYAREAGNARDGEVLADELDGTIGGARSHAAASDHLADVEITVPQAVASRTQAAT